MIFRLSGRLDSNQRPPTPEAGALTGLRYTPNVWNRAFRLVGVTGFEPVTPCSQSRCANRTALHPVNLLPCPPRPGIAAAVPSARPAAQVRGRRLRFRSAKITAFFRKANFCPENGPQSAVRIACREDCPPGRWLHAVVPAKVVAPPKPSPCQGRPACQGRLAPPRSSPRQSLRPVKAVALSRPSPRRAYCHAPEAASSSTCPKSSPGAGM